MVFQRPLSPLNDPSLNHWISFSEHNENFLNETDRFLEELKSHWLADEEYAQLKELIQKKEGDLVWRYLELQIHLRTSKEREHLHLSIDLEKELEKYLQNQGTSTLKTHLILCSMQMVIYEWLSSLGVAQSGPFIEWDIKNFPAFFSHHLENALKEEYLSPQEKCLILDLLDKKEESFEYWNKICISLDHLLLWEEKLGEIFTSLHNHPKVSHLDSSDLLLQLDCFENELKSFHKHFGKALSETILPPFSEMAKAALIGKVRSHFQQINYAYGCLKTALLGEPHDVHLCCMCHFGENSPEEWPLKPHLLNLDELKPFYTHQGISQSNLLIFTCGGGLGHLSVTKAMAEYAKGKYHIQIANTLEETLASTDVFKKMMLDFSQEKFYNHLLKNEEFEWLKVVTSIGPFFLMMQQESIEKQIKLEVLKHSPDMLITCFPCMNAMFLNVAKDLNLPLLMVTTDLDTELFTKGMHAHSCDLNYPHWRMTLAYDTPEMRAVIEKRIPPNKIHISGFPLRPSFVLPPSDTQRETLFKQFDVKPSDRVLVVMIGGVVGRATEKYATLLANLEEAEVKELTPSNLHVIFLCGNQKVQENRGMRLRIAALQPKSQRLKLHSIGAIDDLAALMTIADALITKPGGCTTNEGLAKGLPMIFHAPFALMDWEVFNMEFCVKAYMGTRFKLQSNAIHFFQDGLAKNKQRLIPLIKEAFTRRKQPPHYHFEQKDFGKEFLRLIEELL